MGDFSQSAEELLTKLDTYREQLAQVEEALEQQPDEASLVKLKNDLTEVIVLTEDLVKYQAAAPEGVDTTGPQDGAATTGAATMGGGAATSAGAATSKPSKSASVHTALIGRTAEAFYEQKWYNAEIKSVRRDERGIERCTVDFIGFKNQREYKITDVKMLRPPHPAQCRAGTQCQGIFPEDGLWYACLITEQTEKGYKVTFTEYGTKAEVRFDQVRLHATGRVAEKKRTIKEVATPAGYKIPESLVVQKTDSEEVIETKRRKIQAIKKQQRTDRMDDDAHKKQSSWQKFYHNKASTKAKTGFSTGKVKESIFRVAETLEGKVGVMGSGKEMTRFSEPRKFTYQYV